MKTQNTPQKIVLAGGTGFLGQVLKDYYVQQGWQVVILSRRAQAAEPGVAYIVWDAATAGPWMVALEGAHTLVNLCGRSVDCRYTAENKAEIYRSRLVPTRLLGEAINLCERPPRVWINLSTATIYRHAEDRPMDEHGGELGEGFSVDVARQWEQAFEEAVVPGVRKVALRTAIVLGQQGGAWPVWKRLARLGLGGAAGTGQQYVSWLHYRDFARIVDWLIHTPTAEGAYNAAAPDPIKNGLFMQLLRQALGMPLGLRQPTWVVHVGAWLLRTEVELVLKSRWVLPTRLQQEGFVFQYPTVAGATRALGQKEQTAVIQPRLVHN